MPLYIPLSLIFSTHAQHNTPSPSSFLTSFYYYWSHCFLLSLSLSLTHQTPVVVFSFPKHIHTPTRLLLAITNITTTMPEAPRDYNLFEQNKKTLEFIEDVTANADQVQKRVLSEILSNNANVEYLKRHDLHGQTDRETFKKLLPVITYEDIQPDINRIANGDTSPILCSKPISEFLTRYICTHIHNTSLFLPSSHFFFFFLVKQSLNLTLHTRS